MYVYQNNYQNRFVDMQVSSMINTPIKRRISELEQSSSDCDEVFNLTEDSNTPKQSSTSMTSNSEDSGCHMINRKKRRGMIEKRRRDRINNSLNELRRLVPAAFEKQGSAKLEKAEILQMTVEHLRMLHAKGFDTFSFDPHKFAMDYHSIGFRECLAEVASYLVKYEGMDLQDPLRLRLMSHLQCYSAQRELALKSASNHAAWNPSAFTTPNQFSSLGPSSSVSTINSVSSTGDGMSLIGQVSNSSHYNTNHINPSDSNSLLTNSVSITQNSSHMMPPPPPPPLRNVSPSSSPQTQSSLTYTSNGVHNIAQMSHAHHHHPHQYFPSSYAPTASGSMQYQSNAPGVKYCRPWGTELAY